MQSPKLDETHPTSNQPDEKSMSETNDVEAETSPPSYQVIDEDVTQKMIVKPVAETFEELSMIPPGSHQKILTREKDFISETQPSMLSDEDYFIPPETSDRPESAQRGRHMWVLWAFLGVLLLALMAGGSVYAGYNSAIDQRIRYEFTLVAGEASNQYILAQQDIALGNYDRARQRLEYIIKIDPNFPNVSNQLAFVLTQQGITATPTLIPSPTLTPTPDYRGRDELFGQAQNSAHRA